MKKYLERKKGDEMIYIIRAPSRYARTGGSVRLSDKGGGGDWVIFAKRNKKENEGVSFYQGGGKP